MQTFKLLWFREGQEIPVDSVLVDKEVRPILMGTGVEYWFLMKVYEPRQIEDLSHQIEFDDGLDAVPAITKDLNTARKVIEEILGLIERQIKAGYEDIKKSDANVYLTETFRARQKGAVDGLEHIKQIIEEYTLAIESERINKC